MAQPTVASGGSFKYSQDGGTTTVGSQSITAGQALVVLLGSARESSGSGVASATSVTWDPAGVNEALTSLSNVAQGRARVQAFYILAPTAGTTKDIDVAWASGGGTRKYVNVVVIDNPGSMITEVDTTVTTNSTTISSTGTSAVGRLVLDVTAFRDPTSGGNPTWATNETGQTTTANVETHVVSSDTGSGASQLNGVASPTMSWIDTKTLNDIAQVMIDVHEAVGGAPTNPGWAGAGVW